MKDLKRKIEATIDQDMVNALKEAHVDPDFAIKVVKAAKNDRDSLEPYLQCGTVNRQFDFCPKDSKAEQNYIFKKWRKEKTLLK